MLLIAGLGNPGSRYVHTRHNAGFLALDFLRTHFLFPPFTEERHFAAFTARGFLDETKVLLLAPQTFMNASGESVIAALRFYKLTAQDLCVIHDDVDLPLGTFKETAASRSAGHRGVQDIIDRLGTQDFFRIRLGVGRPAHPEHTTADFVLENFAPEEETTLRALFPEVAALIAAFVRERAA